MSSKAGLEPAIGGGWTRPHPDTLRSWPHWVYRLYDRDNELLYVGCTYLEPAERYKALRRSFATRGIHHWKAHQYPDMDTALAVEGMWIDLVNPPLNGMRSGVAARKQPRSPRPIAETWGLIEREEART